MPSEKNQDTSPAWVALQQTALDELRRRAAILQVVKNIKPTPVEGVVRYAWNDGGGQCAVWYFLSDGRALLLTYDHERALNVYTGGDDADAYRSQLSFFEGAPAELVALVTNQPENRETLNVSDGAGNAVFTASSVFWFDGAAWHIAEGLLNYCSQHNLSVFDDSGFDYCVAYYLLGGPFTAETLVAKLVESGAYESENEQTEARLRIEQLIAEHKD